MPTTYVKGDFLAETPVLDGTRVFAFPAEATGKMDAGVAVAMRRRWPELATWWAAEGGRKKQVGVAPAWTNGSDLVYALAIERAGAKAKLSWLEGAVRAMLADAERRGLKQISAPRLWAGRGGVEGSRAKRIVGELGEGSPVTLVVFEQFIRATTRATPSGVDAAPHEDEAPAEPRARKAKAAAPAKKKPAAKKSAAKKKPSAKQPAAKPVAKKSAANKKSAKG